jgi:putative tryptophan/tyrosine transport system substrate-binding protein
MTEISGQRSVVRNRRAGIMSEDPGCAERFLCVLFAAVVKPISDLQLLISGLCAMLVALSVPAAAQQPTKVPRIGYLSAASAETDKNRFAHFQRGMQELGYIEGKNIVIEQRYAAGQYEKIPELLAELIRLKVDVLVVFGDAAILAAKNATSTIPIVMTLHPDPVGDGIVASLARPGGNVTGLSDLHTVLVTKRLEILTEVVPSASRIAVFFHAGNPTLLRQLKDIEDVAPAFGVKILSVPVTGPDDFDRAFTMMKKERAGALMVLGSPLIGVHRRQILDLVAKSRLPAIYTSRENPDAGGLMSYGANFHDLWRLAATYVDKILKGRKPADLPVEQPTKFEFVINLKAAKQIGLTIPPNVLARADKVIK